MSLFLFLENNALASGIGDKLKALQDLPKINLILIKPRFELSTKMVYENLNLRLTRGKK